jgi:hypothetical protein
MTATPAVDLDALPGLMRLVHRVPAHLRRFTVTAAMAKSRHRVGPELAGLLVDAGLPHVGRGAGRLYDDYDVGNLALHLGLPTIRRMTLRSWAGNLKHNASQAASRLRVQVVPQCPAGPHRGPCTYQVLRPDGLRDQVRVAAEGTPVADLDVRVPGHWPELPSAVRELADEAMSLKFFILPEAIRWDLGFLAEYRIADCGGAAAWLVREGRRRGLPVRFSFGLLLAKPYSTPHCWAEFETDGVWVPYDPLLLTAMRRWTGLDTLSWHPYRSIGPVLYRMCGEFTKISSHNGIWAPVSLITDYRDDIA